MWAQMLRVEGVGVEDNFFELGGDSIISIQVVARARELGVHVSVAQLFEQQTVAGLAAVASAESLIDAEQGPVVGDFPLTPIQRWFLDRETPDPGHFNQSMVLDIAERIEPGTLRAALHTVLDHHDALRSRFVRDGEEWTGRTVAVEPDELLRVVHDGDEQAVGAEAQAGLDLANGPLVRAVLFERGDGGQRLLIVAHHLVMDTVSWPIVLEDLALACERADLPAKTTSFTAWSRRLAELADPAESGYWREVEAAVAPLPRDHDGVNSNALVREVRATLGQGQTERLLREVPGAFRTQINDVLLSVLGQVLTEWCRTPSVVVDLEGHGRADVGADIDVSRTVGWFMSMYPVVLSGQGDGDLGALLRRTKEYLRAVPRKGLGYGLLRYLPAWTPGPKAEVSFNYLGQTGAQEAGGSGGRFRPSGPPLGEPEPGQAERPHLITVNSMVADGRLEMAWTYGGEMHDEATVGRLARRYIEVLGELIEYCCRPGVGGRTPSDFPLAGLDQDGVDLITGSLPTVVEDVYPLTALQQGMVFQAELAAERSMFWVQNGLLLEGELDLMALRLAWELVFARHEVLRTTAVWDRVPEPLAVVSRSVPLPLRVLDLSELDEAAQRRVIDDDLAADSAQGADFSAPTLVRLTVLKLGDGRHRLLWGYHHLLLDGWSVPNVLGEVLEAYHAFRAGRRPRLPKRPPFRDFVAWLAGQDLDEARDYWRERLAGIGEAAPLGTEHATGGEGQGQARVPLPAGGELTAFARRHRLTLNSVIQGAWALVLACYSGNDDVVFGVTSSGRGGQIDGMDAMVGLLLTTTPVRIGIDRDLPVAEWLAALQDEQVRARRFEHTPLTTIAACTDLPSGKDLFNSLFVFENYPVEALEAGREQSAAGGLRAALDHGREQDDYPLNLVAAAGRELTIRLTYDRARFADGAIERMAGNLATVLAAIAADPGQRVGDLPVLTDAERAVLVDEWNDTAVPSPDASGVHELIAATAEARPDAVAVVCDGVSVTYAGLMERAARLAHRLRGMGVGAESLVGCCLERSVDTVVALLAVWHAGGAYLPLDPDYPADRLEFMLADSGVNVLIGHRGALEHAGADNVVWLDDPAVRAELAAAPALPAEAAHPAQPAYVMYTSGSTGRPKGVQVTQGGVVNQLLWMQGEYVLETDDRALQKTPLSFDVSVWELFWPLITGAAVVLAQPGGQRDPAYLAELIEREGITAAEFVPSMLTAFVRQDRIGEMTRSLRRVYSGGEALPAGLVAEVGLRVSAPLHNLYGPTETTIGATAWSCPSSGGLGVVPIGRPVWNTRAYVLDEFLRPVPPGVTGELYLAGVQLARGYLGRAALTAERFVACPFTDTGGERMYRTGDLARWTDDGELLFAGRADEQAKVRGVRIEPGEIEAGLAAHPMVDSAVVAAREVDGGQRLVAYLVPAAPSDGIPSVSELRAFAGERLPAGMVPAVFVELAELPLTPSRKIDRAALPSPEGARAELGGFVAPRTETERVLAEVWAQVLGVERVGREDNFFELGGDSIISIRVVARARDLGVHVSVAQLFDQQTVAGLAAVAGSESLIDAEQELLAGDYPLTPIQRWFLERELREPWHFNQSMVLEVDERVEPERLRRALHMVIEHHDVLRSRFVREDGAWTGRMVAAEPGELLWVAEGDDWARGAEAQASLDLSDGPLLRAVLFERDLLIVVHHLVVDAVSWPILLEDLSLAYEGAELPVKSTSFRAWSQRLTELADSIDVAEVGYWREVEAAGAGPLPRDHDGPNTLALAADVDVSLDQEQTNRLLHEVPGVFRTQINDVLLCVLGVVLTQWAGQRSVLVDLEGHGREDVGPDIDVSRTVGWFTNVYPVVLGAAVDGDPGAALRRTKEYLRAVPRKGLGYGLLRHLTDGASAATAEVAFNYVGQSTRMDGPSDGSGGWFRPSARLLGETRSAEGERTHLIDINSLVVDGRLELKWTYCGQVHEEATIDRLARRYIEVLGELIDHCLSPGVGGRTPSDFPLANLNQEEVDQVTAQVPTVVEDVYPLTGLQQGMVYHTRLATEPGMYWVQSGLLLEGDLDLAALRGAWELVFARHEVFRTTVVWDGVLEPLAVVSRSVPLPLEVLDLRDLNEADRQRAVDDHLAGDWTRGADFTAPSLVRIAVIRIGDDRHQMVWSHHHLMLDGWSLPIVVGEVLEAYHAFRAGGRPRLPARVPFRDFVAWFAGQDLDEAREYWRERLSGVTRATPLGVQRATGEQGQAKVQADVPGTALIEFARRRRLTVNTVVQGAWALVVSLYSGGDDVVLGVTSSGRGGQIDGMDSMVGLLINTTPVRIGVDRDLPVAEWLSRLQDEQARARRFEHTPLAMITEWVGLPAGESLFDTLFVFENYPVQELEEGRRSSAADGLEAGFNHGRERDNYPLTVTAGLGRDLRISLIYDRAVLDAGTIERMSDRFASVLRAIAADAGQHVGDLPFMAAAERDRLDRTELPAAADSQVPEAPDTPYVAPRTEVERQLCQIWAQILDVDRVGIDDGFRELGGRSLLATRVISRIRTVFGVEIELPALFDHPTVRGLAEVVEETTREAAAPPVTAVSREQPLPLSFSQQRLWFLDQLEPGSTDYLVSTPMRWQGDLDVAALGTALGAVVARHEVLRTRLVAGSDGVGYQVVDPPAPSDLPVVDVSAEPEPFRAAERLVRADAVTPFDLAAGPLFRALLIRISPAEHALALSMHHVVADEWSGEILRRELLALYEAFRSGRPDPLPPLAVQYADYALWQRQWLSGEVLEGQVAYWTNQLAGSPALELPTDRPRPPVRTSAGAVTHFAVPPQTAEGLRTLAQRNGASMFMTALAAFSVLLARYSGQDDIVVGTPVAGRNRAETEDLIGFFVNTLVLRTDLSGDPTFTEVLARVRQTALDAYAHQDLPFERLVDALVTERDRSRSPLFQALLNYFTDEGEGAAEDAEGIELRDVVAEVDLRLILTDVGRGLAGRFEYSTDLFDAATTERMAHHMVALLEDVAADAERHVWDLPLLSPAESALLDEWNDTAVSLPDAGGVHELIAAEAAARPDAVAVVCDGVRLTYAGLMERAARLAHHLQGVGVGPETVVGMCLPRGVDMIVAVLATWQAGGAYLPLDPDHPVDRLEFMLADGRVTVLVGTGDLIDDLPVGRRRLVTLDEPLTRASLAAMPPMPPETSAHPDRLAYVIYTSGSTGRPKGVQVTHGGVANLVLGQTPLFGVGRGDAVVQFASFGFDAAVSEVCVTLAGGGTLVVATVEQRVEPGALAGLLRAEGVAVATVPPSLLRVLEPGDLDGVGTLVAAGERLDAGLAEAWTRRHRLLNAYGPTEATVCASAGVVEDGVPSIGAPIANTRLYVLDERLQPVPVGVAGELLVAGAPVARGYGGRPALTAERYAPDPFAADGSRMYRTGDRVRWLPEGRLDFLGRTDDQVKVRGFRVEPGEIEAALTAHPRLNSAVVTVFGEGTDRQLVAHLGPADRADGLPDLSELRAFLRASLPDHMVPSVFTELAALPLTRNGKIDRAALPAPDESRLGSRARFVEPRTEVERVLAGIWAEVLGLARVGVEDDFFELGGHSLLATRMVSRIRDELGVEIPVGAIFDRPTVAANALAVTRSAPHLDGETEYEEFEI
ncbi:amino acid adenylation domain-containing protein [Actinomadura vinacea]|uniref:amino acid adenylation domain-containing protein n=1 Tax=Actinomadura vinacea TaxID=115336 RepID=UPI0031DB1E14